MPRIATCAAWAGLAGVLVPIGGCQDGTRAALGARAEPVAASRQAWSAFSRPAHPLIVSVSLRNPGPSGLVAYRFAEATVDEIHGGLLAAGCAPEAADEFARRLARGELRAWMGTVTKAGEVVEVGQPALAFRAEDGVQGTTVKRPDGSLLVAWSVTVDDERDAPLARGYDYAGDVVFTLGDGRLTVRLPISVRIRKAFTPGRLETAGDATVGECAVRAERTDT